jgi:pilus assembly protein CpaB
MMNRRFLALVLAVACAGVAVFAVLAYVSAADERALAGKQAVTVLVAAERFPAGTAVATLRAKGKLNAVRMPAETVPDDAIEMLGPDLTGLVLTADIQPSQLVLRGMFGRNPDVTGGLVVPEGKIAVSVELTAAEQVAGYVRPGVKIAVFDTFTVMEGKGRIPSGDGIASKHEANHATRLLLPRVEVIAVGSGTEGTTSTSTGGGGAKTPAVAGTGMLVTVAVTQQEAERLVHASKTGSLSLALLTDSAPVRPGPGVDNYTLIP